MSVWLSRCAQDVLLHYLERQHLLNPFGISSRGVSVCRLTVAGVQCVRKAGPEQHPGVLLFIYFLSIWVSKVIMVILWGFREMSCEGL